MKNVNKRDAGRMEENEAATQKETVDDVCAKDSAEKQTSEATEEVSSQTSEQPVAAGCEPEARYSRLKLFDK